MLVHQVLKNEKGSAIVLVLIITGVLTVLGASLLHYSLTDNQQVINDEKRMQAYYLARSGAEAVADYIMKNPEEADNLLGKDAEDVKLDDETEGTFDVEVTGTSEVPIIVSTGHVDGFERTVRLTLVPHSLGDYAVFCNSIIDIRGGAKIKGNVGTNATAEDSIKLSGNSSIDGNVQIGPGGDPETVVTDSSRITKEISQLDSEREYVVPEFPTFPDVTDLIDKGSLTVENNADFTITEDGYYDEINIGNNGSLTINVGNDNDIRKIRVGSFYSKGKIELHGTGKLVLYVDNSFTSDSVNEGGSVESLEVYYKGNDIHLTGGLFCGTINGNIIAKGDSVVIDMTGNEQLKGALFAPEATIALGGNAELNGLVVADTVVITGNYGLNYDDEIYFPYDDQDVCISFRKGLWSDKIN